MRKGDDVALIFISYSREDGPFVQKLARNLRDAGYQVWQDVSGVHGGQEWVEEIDQALRASDAFVLVTSPASLKSDWVRKETLLAMELDKHIIPVLVRTADLPVHLVDLQYLDFRGDGKKALQELLDALSLLTQPKNANNVATTAPPVPGGKPITNFKPGNFFFYSLAGVVLIGIIILLVISGLMDGEQASPTATHTKEVILVHITQTPTEIGLTPTHRLDFTSTPSPRIFNFKACDKHCDEHGVKILEEFSGGVKKIYLQWDYENIPIGANYERVWSLEGDEWARYRCTWPGPESGTFNLLLFESNGLHSGDWVVRVYVNHQLVMEESVHITGDLDYWDPFKQVINECGGLK